MLFKVILVGKPKDKLISGRIGEYAKRLNAYGKLETVFLADGTQSSECAAILHELDKERNATIWILDETGREFSSPELGKTFAELDRKAIFVVGGAFGLTQEVRDRANVVWSLSKLTFPHEIAALLLFEQLYRAENIAHGGKYHH